MELLATVPLLLIDDLGMRKLGPTAAEELLETVMRRYERASTMLTSNCPVEDWGKLLAKAPRSPPSSTACSTTAICSNVALEFGGPNLMRWHNRRGAFKAELRTGSLVNWRITNSYCVGAFTSPISRQRTTVVLPCIPAIRTLIGSAQSSRLSLVTFRAETVLIVTK